MKFYRKLSIRGKLIFAFAILSLMPLLAMGIAAYMTARVSLENQIGISYEQNLRQLAKNLDMELNNVENLSNLALLNRDIIENLNIYRSENAYPKLKAAETLQNQLISMRFSSPAINQVIITCPKNDPLLTGKAIIVAQESYFGSAEFWQSTLYQDITHQQGKPLWRYGIGDSKQDMYLLRQIIDPENAKELGILVIAIDPQSLQSILNEVTPQKMGAIFITDNKFQIISHNDPAQIGKSVLETYTAHPFQTTLSGRFIQGNSLIVFSTMRNGWAIFLEIPLAFLLQDMNLILMWILIAVLVLAGLIVGGSLWLSKSYTRGIHQLVSSTTAIAAGNLDSAIDTLQEDEIGILAHSVAAMRDAIREKIRDLETLNQELDLRVELRTAELAQANTEIRHLNDRLKAENMRMEAELEVTQRLQQILLPSDQELQSIPNLDIAGFMLPADEVGGDYYDVLQENGQVKIGIGDVTGHGLESGVIMLMLQTAVRTLMLSGENNPLRFMEILNGILYKNIQRMNAEKCLFVAIMDYHEGKISLSGQHESVIIVRQGKILEVVDTIDSGMPIGLIPSLPELIQKISLELAPGDRVVLFTDGITEAMNSAHQCYGMERLCAAIQNTVDRLPKEVIPLIIGDVKAFTGQEKFMDDITLVVFDQK